MVLSGITNWMNHVNRLNQFVKKWEDCIYLNTILVKKQEKESGD